MCTDIGLICKGLGKICEGIGIMCKGKGKPLAQSCISNCSAGINRGLTETDGGAGEGSRETCFITAGDVYPHFHPQLPSHSPTHPHIGAPHFLGVDLLWLFIIQAIPKTPILFDIFILPKEIHQIKCSNYDSSVCNVSYLKCSIFWHQDYPTWSHNSDETDTAQQ